MSSYQERLTADMKAAMKSGDKARLGVLRMLIAALKDEQLRSGRDVLEDGTRTQPVLGAARRT